MVRLTEDGVDVIQDLYSRGDQHGATGRLLFYGEEAAHDVGAWHPDHADGG